MKTLFRLSIAGVLLFLLIPPSSWAGCGPRYTEYVSWSGNNPFPYNPPFNVTQTVQVTGYYDISSCPPDQFMDGGTHTPTIDNELAGGSSTTIGDGICPSCQMNTYSSIDTVLPGDGNPKPGGVNSRVDCDIAGEVWGFGFVTLDTEIALTTTKLTGHTPGSIYYNVTEWCLPQYVPPDFNPTGLVWVGNPPPANTQFFSQLAICANGNLPGFGGGRWHCVPDPQVQPITVSLDLQYCTKNVAIY